MPYKDAVSEQLCAAARVGDCDAVRRLLAEGASPVPTGDATAGAEATERHERFQRDMRERMQEILADSNAAQGLLSELSAGTLDQPRTAPHHFEIPLFCASESGNVECLNLILAAGARANQRDDRQNTAMFYAGSAECVRRLVEAGVDLNAVDKSGDDALQSQLQNLDIEDQRESRISVCKAMLEQGVPLVRSGLFGMGRLYSCAFRGDLQGIKFLLDEGHPIRTDTDTGTALHAICWQWGNYHDERDDNIRAIIRTLLTAGLSVHDRNEKGNTPLHEALSGDGVNLVAAEELLAAGADINAVNSDGATPLLLHYETLFDYDRVVPFMLTHGANPLIADRHGQTVLDAARAMIKGEQPKWRTEAFGGEENIPCGWKEPAEASDKEHEMLALLETAARRFQQD